MPAPEGEGEKRCQTVFLPDTVSSPRGKRQGPGKGTCRQIDVGGMRRKGSKTVPETVSTTVSTLKTGYPGGHFGVAMRCAFFSAPQRLCHPRSSLVCIFSSPWVRIAGEAGPTWRGSGKPPDAGDTSNT